MKGYQNKPLPDSYTTIYNSILSPESWNPDNTSI